ncbi:hypothetical protein [Bacillus sp. 2205SS5-2]|uniref:hypothetical protein n=1 Tax=Bacillus sp. 2205SS5-2 TaxID=3109031 RepID=UPI003006BB56
MKKTLLLFGRTIHINCLSDGEVVGENSVFESSANGQDNGGRLTVLLKFIETFHSIVRK